MASRRKGRGVDQKGRSKKGPPFVRLIHHFFDCPAYRSLKPGPRALLWELIRKYNGNNNGQISLGVREAVEKINIKDKDTVGRYFKELEVKGFIRATKRGGFNVKVPSASRATEWCLTWQRLNDHPPTNDFLKWKDNEIHGPDDPLASPDRPDTDPDIG